MEKQTGWLKKVLRRNERETKVNSEWNSYSLSEKETILKWAKTQRIRTGITGQ